MDNYLSCHFLGCFAILVAFHENGDVYAVPNIVNVNNINVNINTGLAPTSMQRQGNYRKLFQAGRKDNNNQNGKIYT